MRDDSRSRLVGAAVAVGVLAALSPVGTGSPAAAAPPAIERPRPCLSVPPGPPQGPWAEAWGFEGDVWWAPPPDIVQRRTCGPVTAYKVLVRWGESNCNTYVEPDRTIRERTLDGATTSMEYWADDWTQGWYSFAVTAETRAGVGQRSGWSTPICLGRR